MDTIKKLYLDFILSFSKTRFYLILFLGLILSIITIIEPLFLSEIIKQVEEFLKTWNFSQNAFFYVVISWIIFETFYLSYFFYYRFYIADVHALKNHNKVFSRKIWKIIRMSYWAYLSKKSGSIYKNFDRWTWAQFDSVFFFFNDFIINIFQVVILIIFLLFIDVRMTLISLSLVPVMAFVGIYFNKKTNLKQMELNKTYDKIFWWIWDFFNNFVLSKTLNLEKIFEKEEKNLINETYKKQYSISKSWAIVSIYTNVIVWISRFLLIGFWAYFVINWSLEFYKLFLFYAYINYVYFPLSFLFSSFWRIQKIVSSAESFYREFDNLETENLEIWENLENISWNIEFKNVNFWYLEEKKILKDLSFSIKKWETVAFVWNTWAWKSTILNLILKLWKINSGEIIVDWKNLENISKKSLRMHIWVVNQEVWLYNDTLRQNMLYANPKASEKEIFEALEKAEANFVKKLENWIDTIIWERWLKLSWWEKQRIAIARLFLKNPKILILDEATSALDNKTEKLVQKALEKLMKGKTSIVIAHRLSTIQNADKIFFLENWEIKESGTYEELIVKNGKFAELANPKNLIIN